MLDLLNRQLLYVKNNVKCITYRLYPPFLAQIPRGRSVPCVEEVDETIRGRCW
jgi:hypothetical protein